jgi:hypothetical protein
MGAAPSRGVLVSDWQTFKRNMQTDIDQGYKVIRKVAEADA